MDKKNVVDLNISSEAYSLELLRPTAELFDENGLETEAACAVSSMAGAVEGVESMRQAKELDVLDEIDPAYTPVFMNWPTSIFAGKVLAISERFMAQDIGNKRAKIHVVKELELVPAVGDWVKIVYQQGKGRVEFVGAR